MFKTGLSTNKKTINEDLFREYKNAGIEAMEISVPYEKLPSLDFASLLLWSERYEVKLWSFHLPFMPFEIIDISSSDEHIRRNSIKLCAEYIKKAAHIGINKFVIHPSGEPIKDNERKERIKRSKESLNELAETAYKENGIIAVENLPRTCLGKNSAEILGLAEANGKLRVCFDTNHLLEEDIISFIQKTGDKIATIHVSDYDFINERHWLPGEGKIDWQALFKALVNAGYIGPWLYEVAFICPNTIKRGRDLTCADFKRNAEEIFSGAPITVISGNK